MKVLQGSEGEKIWVACFKQKFQRLREKIIFNVSYTEEIQELLMPLPLLSLLLLASSL